ncbi:MAG: hypothetical protein L0271_07910 [Gemmatimonadetes bacterium]|nr:hypothetical protein [Gemmatimonadota bacterium]
MCGGRRFSGSHLLWIPAIALVGFLSSFVLGDLVRLPVDVYYATYFAIVIGFFVFYAKRTQLDLGAWTRHRWTAGLALGIVGGIILAQGVLARPETARFQGAMLGWAVLWRGVVYGSIDGLLLFAFPFIVIRRALGAGEGNRSTRIRAGVVAWAAMILVTTTYHIGYADFRSPKIIQPNLGSAIGSLPTLLTANPIASPISHIMLHVTAVLHAPHTDLYLPPHREMRGDPRVARLLTHGILS